jgi:quercetin dioxygenase-like cupin family protein
VIRFAFTLVGMTLVFAPQAARSENAPDALSVEWQGQKPCEKVYEDEQMRVARCMFPPGSKHVRHSHPGYLSYVLSGGKGQIEDEKGTRQVELVTGTYSNSPALRWHELANTGDTTLGFLILERKYEPLPGAK